MAAIPIFKLGVLIVKQLTKPMSRAMKSRAQTSESLANVCAFLGQQWHAQTTRINLLVQGHRVKEIKPLNEQEAIQSGSELVAETFVLSVAVGALIAETNRSARAAEEKSKQKEARRIAKQRALKVQLDEVHELLKESVEYSLAMKHALEASKPVVKNLPPVPPKLQALVDEGGAPSMLAGAGNTTSGNSSSGNTPGGNASSSSGNKSGEGDSKDDNAVMTSVVSKLSESGLSSVIKWIGGLINNANEGEEGEAPTGPMISSLIEEEEDD